MTGLDEALALEAVYYSAPIPRDLATLTVLGTVFDKVYFPGVYLPKDGFDEAALDREIERLEALPDARTNYDTALLIGVLKMAKFARTLDGFCVFTNTREDPFKASNSIPAKMVTDISNAIHGPLPKGVIPTVSTNNHKGLPGGNEHVTYPGAYRRVPLSRRGDSRIREVGCTASQRLFRIAHSRSRVDNAAGQCQNSFGHSGDRMHQARTAADSNSSSG
jgi:hypothetical protein